MVDREIEQEERRRARRMLWRWARATAYCACRHKDIEEYQELIDSAADIRPQQLTGMPHGGGTSDPTQRSAERIEKLKEIYALRIDELTGEIDEEIRFCMAIEEVVRSFTFEEQSVVDMRYKREFNFEKIAERTRYSSRRVQQIEQSAVDKLRKHIAVDGEESQKGGDNGIERIPE